MKRSWELLRLLLVGEDKKREIKPLVYRVQTYGLRVHILLGPFNKATLLIKKGGKLAYVY